MTELHVHKVQREAAERLQAILARPDRQRDFPLEDEFDPWDIFPCLLGCYSKAFDDLAIEVLEAVRDKRIESESLAHQMFREILCTAELCDYGSSPRACFATAEFEQLLPVLIDRWKVYRHLQWGSPIEIDQGRKEG